MELITGHPWVRFIFLLIAKLICSFPGNGLPRWQADPEKHFGRNRMAQAPQRKAEKRKINGFTYGDPRWIVAQFPTARRIGGNVSVLVIKSFAGRDSSRREDSSSGNQSTRGRPELGNCGTGSTRGRRIAAHV